ncbi:SH2 domain-containing protein [Pisolithus sp. B1]|nr:SH2 domain-containing protein [Pisolithus sp. B1]
MVALDITEINTPSRPILAVDDKHQYTDLDELIVNHVQAIVHKVEELMAHKKFKHGPKDELHEHHCLHYPLNFVAANPAKSAYGFMLNCRKPGHFNLCFLANKNATVQTWVHVLLAIGYTGSLLPQPVHVTPESYCLFKAPVTGIPELCNAFKVRLFRHLHQSQNLTNAGVGGKTPYSAGALAKPQLHHLLMEVASLVLAMGYQVNPLLVIQLPPHMHPTPATASGTAPTSHSSRHEPTACSHDPGFRVVETRMDTAIRMWSMGVKDSDNDGGGVDFLVDSSVMGYGFDLNKVKILVQPVHSGPSCKQLNKCKVKDIVKCHNFTSEEENELDEGSLGLQKLNKGTITPLLAMELQAASEMVCGNLPVHHRGVLDLQILILPDLEGIRDNGEASIEESFQLPTESIEGPVVSAAGVHQALHSHSTLLPHPGFRHHHQ